MKRLLYILLCLSLTFSVQGQELFFQHNYAAPAGGGGGGCADANATAYMASLVAQGKTLTSADSSTICTLYTDLASNGLYSLIYSMHDYSWGVANYNKKDLINPSGTDASFTGSPTFLTSGTQLNGSSQHINSGYAPSGGSNNSRSMGLYVTVASTSSNSYLAGALDASASTFFGMRSGASPNQGTRVAGYVHDASLSTSNATTATGCIDITRTSSTAKVIYRNGSAIGTFSVASSSNTISNAVFVGAANNAGSPILRANLTVAMDFYHQAFDATQEAAFNTIIEAYMDAKGIGVQ